MVMSCGDADADEGDADEGGEFVGRAKARSSCPQPLIFCFSPILLLLCG